MTDEETICTWMEPTRAYGKWWSIGNAIEEQLGEPVYFRNCAKPMRTTILRTNVPIATTLTLDALHEVEERLTDEQWRYFEAGILHYSPLTPIRHMDEGRRLLHATAEQKIKALASVLRAGLRTPVEGEKP